VGTTTAPRHDAFLHMDLRDPASVDDAVQRAAPERVWHLAAQSRAARSWDDPASTYEVNVTGTHFLLEALRRRAPAARVLLASTGDVYGLVDPALAPFSEAVPLRPVSPYAASKVAQEWVGRMFADAHGMHVVTTRAFYHVGPGQRESFALASWARQVARAEAGLAPPEVVVGRLDLVRDIGDVRDVVRAYVDVLEHGTAGEVYNVATERGLALGEVLDVLLSRATASLHVRVDDSLIRPADPPVLRGSAAKLERATGWRAASALEDTLEDMLEEWRNTTRAQKAVDVSEP
jgi:GDP-4-dehydro-6-deoxy-D-mannose reductase